MTSDPSPRVKVALDAMGGDFGPAATVPAALLAAQRGGVEVLLVGDPAAIQEELSRHPSDGLPVTVVPSEGMIGEGKAPIQALRQNPRASVMVGTSLVKEGRADALVTMGSTGAAMAASSMVLGLLEGIERPALGGPIIGLAPNMVLLELGANVDCRPGQLVDFAALGVAFAQVHLKVSQPRVALLSVGSEAGKGNRQTREAAEAFAQSGLNFIGNVEGHDLVAGRADVVVCDGFVGNILMKTVEGIGDVLSTHLRQRLRDLLPQPQLEALGREVYDLLNLAEHVGGGPLFGVRGLVVVGHGRASAQAVAAAIETARYSSDVGLLDRMEDELRQLRARTGGEPAASRAPAVRGNSGRAR